MMHFTRKAAGLALAATLLASPVLAQGFPSDSQSTNRDGTLNVWGAHIDPPRARGGLLGGVGNVVGGVGTVVGGVVGGTVGAADDIVTGSLGPRRGEARAYDGATAGQRDGFAVQGGDGRRGYVD